MIHEYVIAPSVLASWADNKRDYREFFREYGLGSPRLLSSFPKAKATKLKGYFFENGPQDPDSLQGQRYTEMVDFIVEVLIDRPIPNNPSTNWEDMVRFEHEQKPFNVIITNPKLPVDRCISPSCMYDSESLWLHKRQVSIQRQVTPVLENIRNFLLFSTQQVVIVDAFGWKPFSIDLIKEVLRLIHRDRVNSKLPIVKLFYKESSGLRAGSRPSPSASNIKESIIEELELNGIELKVYELREIDGNDVFHNRCILTEHGGASCGHGVDLSGEEAHTDDWFLLEKEIYDKKWQQFIKDCQFEIVSEA
ncbi:hypothetical protein AAIA71_17420 [Vibrio harveyi]|uniref:hypothetical protein n=1 Tax=Vibrio harveyi TaxID=669 RepID=UPI0003F780A6|nr:hypothetical protein [Vibrio harveyi]